MSSTLFEIYCENRIKKSLLILVVKDRSHLTDVLIFADWTHYYLAKNLILQFWTCNFLDLRVCTNRIDCAFMQQGKGEPWSGNICIQQYTDDVICSLTNQATVSCCINILVMFACLIWYTAEKIVATCGEDIDKDKEGCGYYTTIGVGIYLNFFVQVTVLFATVTFQDSSAVTGFIGSAKSQITHSTQKFTARLK